MIDPAPTVLVVDDEAGIRDLVRTWLDEQYTVRTAGDGDAALDMVDEAVDVALLDRRMPGRTGDEVLEAFRERGFDFPVAMMTAVSPDVDIVDMGFDDYVVKPVTRQDVQSVVKTLLRRTSYDEKSRQFFRLASKKAKLESYEAVDHRTSVEYDALLAEMGELRGQLDDVLETLSAADYKRVFERI